MKKYDFLEIIGLNPTLTSSLVDFFSDILDSGDNKFFHPHPLTSEEAAHLCNYSGKDQYYVMLLGKRIIGYGMLRGWDEGYKMPSLGIYLHNKFRGKGLGALLLMHLHTVARLKGADTLRIKVYKDNKIAKKLYDKAGYIFDDINEDQLIGFLKLLS